MHNTILAFFILITINFQPCAGVTMQFPYITKSSCHKGKLCINHGDIETLYKYFFSQGLGTPQGGIKLNAFVVIKNIPCLFVDSVAIFFI
jgi:hypothetical protein